MVSKARLDLPLPDSPVMTVSRSRGSSTVMSLRLCSRAPRTTRSSCGTRRVYRSGATRTSVRFGDRPRAQRGATGRRAAPRSPVMVRYRWVGSWAGADATIARTAPRMVPAMHRVTARQDPDLPAARGPGPGHPCRVQHPAHDSVTGTTVQAGRPRGGAAIAWCPPSIPGTSRRVADPSDWIRRRLVRSSLTTRSGRRTSGASQTDRRRARAGAVSSRRSCAAAPRPS